MNIEEIVKERIEENKGLFTEEELKSIEKNKELVMKIYLLGVVDNK